ncbi:MAG: hypothetical protein K0R29_915 [Pseudobdellovibrio sp.]|nr:hypothetical protein [Pseudobdellovibrio sp.]
MFNLLLKLFDVVCGKFFTKPSKIFAFALAVAVVQPLPAPEFKVNGMRIDISYMYKLYPKKKVGEVVSEIIENSKKGSINTLFIYAFSSVYGAYYMTDYKFASVEKGFGIHNILKELTTAAKSNGIRVVAVVPINSFKEAWEKNPEWRVKDKKGRDYRPGKDIYPVSLWHPEFRKWVQGLYEDLLYRHPDLDGLEALEPSVDFNWNKQTDYNPVATATFKSFYPDSPLGGDDWLFFRARGMTEVIAIMNASARNAGKKSYVVHTWPAKSNGKLYTGSEIKEMTGLDIHGLLKLEGPSKLDYLVTELIWQQWAAEYGKKKFTAQWPKEAAKEVIKFVNHRSGVMIHVEPTPFKGKKGQVVPSLKEFSETLTSLRDLNVGVGVYDYNQIVKLNAWSVLALSN